jgi:O-antigen biosynthesis protein
LQIIVVDNGSGDTSRQVTEDYKAEWLPLSRNYGYPYACNAGARQARGDYLLFLNNDIVLEPDCVFWMVRAAQEKPDAFTIDAVQISLQDRSTVQHKRTFLKRGSWFANTIPGYQVEYRGEAEILCQIPWACAGCMLVSRTRFWELGGFTSDFFIDFEDVDICLRAGLSGYASYLEPRARLYHGISQTANEIPPEEKAQYLKRRLLAQQKNRLWIYSIFWPMPKLAGINVLYALKILLYFFTGKFSASGIWLRAWLSQPWRLAAIRRERKRWMPNREKTVLSYLSQFIR